jgi:hypothetical protein
MREDQGVRPILAGPRVQGIARTALQTQEDSRG